jgi:hypothetical protein
MARRESWLKLAVKVFRKSSEIYQACYEQAAEGIMRYHTGLGINFLTNHQFASMCRITIPTITAAVTVVTATDLLAAAE